MFIPPKLETKLVNNKIHSKCPRCKQYSNAHSQAGHSFDSGIGIAFIGGYGNYYDPFTDEDTVYIELCHTCSNEVLKFIGVYDDKRFHGGHPTERNAEPCCDNCWIPIEENGTWVGTNNPRTNQINYHRDENGRYIE